MKYSSYLRAAFGACASLLLAGASSLSADQLMGALKAALSSGRLRGGALEAQATLQPYAVDYLYSGSDCAKDTRVAATALAMNRCMSVTVPFAGTLVPADIYLRCGDKLYIEAYLGPPSGCTGVPQTFDLAANGFVVGACTAQADGYTLLECSDGVTADLLEGPGIGFYGNDSCEADLVAGLFVPEADCTRISDSKSFSSACESSGELKYQVYNTSGACEGDSTLYSAAAESCDDSIDLQIFSNEFAKYFTYSITLATCNASNIGTFATASDNDDTIPAGDDDDAAALGHSTIGLWAVVVGALVTMNLAAF